MEMGNTSETGNFGEQSLAALLTQLHRDRFSGRLSISHARQRKSFVFQEGMPVFAESNRSGGGLGLRLLESGQISESDHSQVQDFVKREKVKEATALLALELIDPKALMAALRQQVHDHMVDCFAWVAGEFALDRDEKPPESAQMLRPDLYAMLQEGVETHWTVDQVLADLGPNMNRYPVPNASFERVRSQLRADEATCACLHGMDGTRPFWQTLQAAITPRAMAAAWVVNAVAAVDYSDEPVAAPEDDNTEARPQIEIVVETSDEPAAAATPAVAKSNEKKPEAPPAAGDATAELVRKIRTQFENLSSLDHYALLGIESDAERGAVKRAYLIAAKTYHPDALSRSGVSNEVKELASKVFAEIGKAHSVLSDPRERRNYDAERLDGGGTIDADRLASAEMMFRKGEILLRSGNFKGAIEFLASAVESWPDEGAYQGALGWALFKKTPPEPEAAMRHLQIAVELSPKDAENWYRLSLVLRETGDTKTADDALKFARRIDPDIG
jgi:tetratricopeptide (TPR) repeat protein